MNKREKMYVITYWSPWGMGSDTEAGLITGSNLRELILMETEKYVKQPERADSRFSGTCEGETLCDSADPEERVNDVIRKRLNTCTTYARQNDLIELPDSVNITSSKLKLDNTIVRVFNQFGYARDIIFGEGEFTLYSLDLEHEFFRANDILSTSHEDGWMRYAEYSLKNVAENHMDGFGELDWLIGTARDKIKTDEYVAEQIEEARATLEKFSDLPSVKDEYYSYIYDAINCRDDYWQERLNYLCRNDRPIDHTKLGYNYPISPGEFGVKYTAKKKDASRHLTYSELFENGYDMRYLIADFSNWAQREDELGMPDLFAVFLSVFGYD